MDLESFFKTTRDDIEERLNAQTEGTEEKERLRYFLNHGKRLRPLLCILVFKACGGKEEGYKEALDLAATIELQHSASLVHDDIIDGDLTRRDRSSYHRIFGVEDAILIGHRAIVLGFKNALGHSPKIMETLLDVWEESLEGELKDIEARKEIIALLESGVNYYFDAVEKKTASLFAGAAKIGSQEAKAPEELQNIFWEYGKQLGIAYQLADDSKDICSGNIEALSLTWIVKQLDDATRRSFIGIMKKSPKSLINVLSELNIDAQVLFLDEIAKRLRIAENIARSTAIPENKFKPLLLDAPNYMIDKLLENKYD